MIPIEIEADVRALEVMVGVSSTCSSRPYEPKKDSIIVSRDLVEPTTVVERFVIDENGKMRIDPTYSQ